MLVVVATDDQKECESMSEEYVRLFANLDEEEVLALTRQRIEAGEDPMSILDVKVWPSSASASPTRSTSCRS
jgi:methanogenic corrinoid protein MtbC1